MTRIITGKPFVATHQLRHRETGTACDKLMRVETPNGERFYTESSWVCGRKGLEPGELPSFDIEPLKVGEK
jgi:hypothetical protein